MMMSVKPPVGPAELKLSTPKDLSTSNLDLLPTSCNFRLLKLTVSTFAFLFTVFSLELDWFTCLDQFKSFWFSIILWQSCGAELSTLLLSLLSCSQSGL